MPMCILLPHTLNIDECTSKAHTIRASGTSMREATKEIVFTEGFLRGQLKKRKQFDRFQKSFSKRTGIVYLQTIWTDVFCNTEITDIPFVLFRKSSIPDHFSSEIKLAEDFNSDFM
ncbi:hypothetical protein CEXT_339141 [Caerostris extrusa]|uniref:Ribosomal protein L5 n=1 Tax=Caerostris extrusa TaxID=172846 RepID=A0AAV4SEN0_CAEEX|nr:hypothetical protein CEXT_339141 [Caerostris extrusa]